MTDPEQPMALVEWAGDLRFNAGAPGGPQLLLDGNSKDGVSPVTTMLCAAGACSGADVVSILEKKRIVLTHFHVEVGGTRRDQYPRRFTQIWLRFHLSGEGLTEIAARRAVDLSVEKYCTVLQSMNPDIPIRTEVVIS